MNPKKIIVWLLLAALVLSTAGCADDPNPTQPPTTTQPPVSQTVQNNDFERTGMLAAGQSVTLTADQLPQGGEVVWSSSDIARATVDANGTVTALADRGTVTVTATSGENTQSWQIPLCQQTPFGSICLDCSNEKLTIGIWNGAFHWFDETYTKLMADAGISLLIGVKDKWIWEGDGSSMLDTAQKYGVSILADLRDWDGETVPEYVNYPALKGFLMYDEPPSPKFEELAMLKDQFEMIMPDHLMFFVNISPEACSYEFLYGDDYNPLQVDYETYYLKNFMDTVKTEYLSYDGYGLQEGGYIRISYFHNFDVASQKAKQDGVPFWYTFNSSGHWTTDGRYVAPTDQELRWQMLLGMTFGADTLNYYVLTSPEEDDENMLQYASWEPTAIYDYAKQVNPEFLAWDDIYMHYDWVGTAQYDAGVEQGKSNPMLNSLEYMLPFTQTGVMTGVQSDEDLLIGVFQKNNQNAYLVTNAGAATKSQYWYRHNFEMKDTQVSLQLTEGDYLCAAVINRGQIRYVQVNADNTVDFTVSAYDGVFVIPILAP